MSTAGKILVVLVTLALMGWIVLFSAVAQLNANWGQKIVKQEKEVEDLRAKVDDLAAQVEKNQGETSLTQLQLTKDLVVLRSRLADAEKGLSETNETNTRYKFNLQTAEAAAKDAQETKDRRESDLAALKKQQAQLEAEVRQVKQVNDTLLAQHDRLQREFLKTTAENKELARRAARNVRQTSR